MMNDHLNNLCKICNSGTYQETELFDNWDGTLHCNKCDHKVDRFQ